jgi:hypothetical protein
MQKIHTVKPDSLKCTQCQIGFKSQELLIDHRLNVDCKICCPDCDEVFEKKVHRGAHQVKAYTKQYSDYLKKGTGSLDPQLMTWIQRNTDRFMLGRQNPKVNAVLELGQWYIMFCALSSPAEMVEHPCKSLPYKHLCTLS